MTRICIDCKKIYGEKCAVCGSIDLAFFRGGAICRCNACENLFRPGGGGTTGGYCPPCLDRWRERARASRPARLRALLESLNTLAKPLPAPEELEQPEGLDVVS